MTTAAIPASSIPHIKGMPFLGNLSEFRSERLDLLTRVAQECGDIGAFGIGPRTVYLANSPELAKAVYVDHAYDFEKTANLRVHTRRLLGNGLLTSEMEFHKKQRKLVAPALSYKRVIGYADVMAAYGERLHMTWTDGETVDVGQEMMRLTLGIVGKTLFDADVLEEADELGEALTVAMRQANASFGSLVHLPQDWPTPRNRRAKEAAERLDETIYRIIAQHRASGEDKGDLLSMLLASQDEDGSFMSDQQVRDESMTLFLAGHETTANALAWAWYLLSRNPEIYARLRAEVDAVLAGRTPTHADLASLPYSLQVFKEALRIYPPAYLTGRVTVREVEIEGYTLPVDTVVLVSPYTMHRRPDLFPEPERFDPERFSAENEAKLPKHAFIPFGGGPRICIGNHFALMEGQILLATLAQRVRFDLAPGQEVEPEPLITLRPKHGIQMRVTRR
ncbi:MAG TPA: cytochrome P450 [Ktedonobacterales bacterium]